MASDWDWVSNAKELPNGCPRCYYEHRWHIAPLIDNYLDCEEMSRREGQF